MPSTPTLLFCTSAPGRDMPGVEEAAQRAGVRVRVVSDRCEDLPAPWRANATPTCFDRAPQHVDALLRAIEGTPVDGVLATGDGPAWVAAQVARARGLAWHSPEAVALSTDRLLARGRFLAAGLPVPWFVGLPARGEEDLDRLTRVRFPCSITPAASSSDMAPLRVGSLPDLLAARDRIAAMTDSDTVVVEGIVPGHAFALDGVLEQGALRVFALFESPVLIAESAPATTAWVTPARMPPARQHVVAGHVARAALVLGLHHGPLHAECRVEGDDIVVLDVRPRPLDGVRARAVPVVAPDRSRCTLDDVWIAHALGQSLDHYGHQAIASGVATVPGPDDGADAAARADVRGMPWVTDVEVELAGGVAPAVVVFAQGAQPDDVIATLGEAARRLRGGGKGDPTTPTV